jgi:2-polyprenyl-3-methyl-5-hydroxy-6-metoxy-1,4-benzoquinol methylase
MEWLPRLRRGRALDVAMGRGRHALPMARAGFRVFGVDIRYEAIREATIAAAADSSAIRGWCADLTQHPLPRQFFDLIVVTRYLQRDLFTAIREAAVPGGTVIYETFTTAQRALGRGPTSPAHLLEPGELRRHFAGFAIQFAEEVEAPDALARIVATKR